MPDIDPVPSAPSTITIDIPPRSPWFAAAMVLLTLLIGAIVYFITLKPQQNFLNQPENKLSASSAPITTVFPDFTPMEDAEENLVYIVNDKPSEPGNEQVWLINPNTQVSEQLMIEDVVVAFKHYGQPTLHYTITNQKGEYHVLDLSTGKDTVYDLIDHSDKTASVSISVNNIMHLSPDGKYLVFEASFFSDCPSPSPFPSAFEGGFGPCGPDESLEAPSGLYLYDFANHKAIHIGGLARVARWDTEKQKLYLVDYENGNDTKMINLATKTFSEIDRTESFGYFLYPLLKANYRVKFEGGSGNEGDSPFGRIYLTNSGDTPDIEIDNSPTWTDIQPFITSSPSDSDVLYRRSINMEGIHHNSIYRYNLESGETTRLTKDESYLSYNIYLSWINDYTFVTSVDPIENEQYDSSNQYLVKIDVRSGEETRLTSGSNIQRFNSL